jgi:drug/metabolite transporter (DMT)-like permease
MGEFVAICAAISYALSNVLVKKGTTTSSQNNGAFLSLLQTVMMSGLVWIIVIQVNGLPAFTTEGILWFLIGGVLSAFFGRTFQYSSVQYLGSVRASAIKNLNPMFTVVLGILLLGESVSLYFLIGVILIFGSMYLIVRQSISQRKADSNQNGKKAKVSLLNIGYLFGVLSAFAYAIGFVIRKWGLESIPDPMFGVFLGGCVGIVIYAITAMFKERYMYELKNTLTTFQPWLFYGGLAMSLGQILNFIAIFFIEVSRASLLVTTQSIFSIIFTLFVFKTNENLTKTTIICSIIMVVGAFFIILS